MDRLSLAAGLLNTDVDFAVGKRFTIGPSISMLKSSLLFTEASGFNLGVRGNLYLSGDALNDGWLVGPSIGFSTLSVRSGIAQGSASKLSLGAIAGYQWVWGSGLNITAGAGASWYSGGDEVAVEGDTLSIPFYHGVLPAAELTLGYAF
jgi:hypothetical protein